MKQILLIPFALLIASCSFTRPLEIFSTPVEKPALDISHPAPLDLEDAQFYVITPDNAKTKLAEIEAKGFAPVAFSVSEHGYEVMAINLEQLQGYIIEQKAIIEAYKNYYEKVE